MTIRTFSALAAATLLAGCATVPASTAADPTGGPAGALSALPAIGTVDSRFLSYNVEMVEITGGRFWRPYGSPGKDPHEYRPPMDLSDAKLVALAKNLSPAYVRYSGTWANATWFADSDKAPDKAPEGFDQVLTRQQWRGAVNFAKASGSEIVTSFAVSSGTHDAQGVWQTDTAARWLAYTHEIGGHIAATEFGNEANMISLLKVPANYSGADYRRDYGIFANWLRKASPKTLLLAPGYAELGEPMRTMSRQNKTVRQIEADELLTTADAKPDVFTFHFYGGASERCGGKFMGYSMDKALTPAWFDLVDPAIARMIAMRDAVTPGLPIWNTESAEAACGGNPWAATFADSFRFVDTLGRTARQGVKVFMHNTLAASDYALLDEHSYDPRPNYWAAVLWKRTMGTTVLAAPAAPAPDVRVYAQCLPGRKGGVGLAMFNTGQAAQSIPVGGKAQAWVLQAPALDSKAVTVNGIRPALDGARLTGLDGAPVSGEVALPARSVVFVAAAGAGNPACR